MTPEYADAALLLMDIQAGIVDRLADPEGYLAGAAETLAAARGAGLPVLHVVVGFRPGFPEISPRNQAFRNARLAMPGLADARPSLAPAEGEAVVVKRRVSAFAGSDLEVLLRARELRHLVLGGIATSGVVLSTLREAADKDYQLTVLSDVCADFDAEVHAVLMGKVFPRQAAVLTRAAWIERLSSR
jgi:nicotinamidase-related amidase